jgi:hypothetical protein
MKRASGNLGGGSHDLSLLPMKKWGGLLLDIGLSSQDIATAGAALNASP